MASADSEYNDILEDFCADLCGLFNYKLRTQHNRHEYFDIEGVYCKGNRIHVLVDSANSKLTYNIGDIGSIFNQCYLELYNGNSSPLHDQIIMLVRDLITKYYNYWYFDTLVITYKETSAVIEFFYSKKPIDLDVKDQPAHNFLPQISSLTGGNLDNDVV